MPEKLLQERFRKLSRFPEAFCSIQYTGTRTYNPPTDFSGVLQTIEQQLNNNATRSPRPPGIIFKALKALSDRFNGEIADDQMAHSCFFPDEYFTCSCTCLSCGARSEFSEEFAHLSTLLIHQKVHTVEKPLICSEGGKDSLNHPLC
ncbi:zinc finger FYVE domain-containing protein 1-like [Rhincodon typus]|uniref:zinc finger FYVE domain-containing protein 1-like n=1 Tax=Rhincodon typus TaxID=259920 RepID=UPI00202FCA84|nr:zinc finger FYVE domain-containing protein 1-like [Rhincodon typus]